ncbi:FprA family A-type flavoprotein [Spirochaeta africana]|uniref:Putative flavoprotein n=1 Tax=Spirochaeta africana (strain ATCC 700263 / DSM 8902 / Z-7692) TaxID=889378 RepID=H9UIB7_SPIAZ|nr:FprA family A-type flavoprotein [Spirochaeta africana]AFG37260.1 putative flavoprotein [Spirochaeta africana DSM 8902]
MSENTVTEVVQGVYRLSANVDNILFEGIWPIPKGVAMNSYIVKGDKVAIIDGVCEWDGVPETLFAQLEQMQVKVEDIDYVILNHLEPDHTGWLNAFKKIRSDFTIVTSKKGAAVAEAFYGITENIHTVSSGDEIDLGQGRVLQFYEIPNVHWPETIATYDTRSKTLFPCDAFGSFGSVSSSAPYDDQLTQDEIDFFEDEALRYYANIVGAFSLPTRKAIEKLGPLDIQIIAPGHGIVWRKDPAKIVNDYIRYVSYSKGPAKPHVTVIWGSMYGMTEQGVQPVVEGLESAGVTVHVHRIPESNISYILKDVWQSTGVVLGMPTYEYKMFPPMVAALDEIGKKKALNRKAFRFGSYGWSGGAQKELDEITERLKMNWDFIEPVEFKGAPSAAELELIRTRGRELGEAVVQAVNAASGS